MERRDPEARLTKMCVVHASFEMPGMSSCPVCVACMMSLFGSTTWMPLVVDLTLVTATFV